MTKFTIELAAEDDYTAVRLLHTLLGMMWQGQFVKERKDCLAPWYGVSDIIGSVECKVERVTP